MGAQGATGAQGAQGPQGNPAIGGYGLYAARPAAGNVGARYVTSDGGIEWVDDGSVWRPLIGGTAGGQVPLVAAFTNYGGIVNKNRFGRSIGHTSRGNFIARRFTKDYASRSLDTQHFREKSRHQYRSRTVPESVSAMARKFMVFFCIRMVT